MPEMKVSWATSVTLATIAGGICFVTGATPTWTAWDAWSS